MFCCFLRLNTADRVKQVVNGIRDEQGRVLSEEVEMVHAATDYYRAIFREKEVDVGGGKVFLDFLTQRVLSDIAQALEAPLTLKELEGAFHRMNRDCRCFIKFWDIFGPVVLAEILHTGEIGGSLATGVISLLFKKGDHTNLRNWWPLTMLCVDYKLLA